MMRLALIMLVLAMPCRAALPDVSGLGFVQNPGAAVPLDTPFVDYDGTMVTLRALMAGRPAVLLLGYYHCPSLCGIVRDDSFNALSQVGLATPGDYVVIDISIDPSERPADAAVARTDDLERFPVPGADRGWHFLTGTAPDIAAVADSVGFRSRWDPQLQQFLHAAGMVVLTPGGTVASYALGVGFPAAELRAALLRARDGAISAPASAILLLCYHFDSTTGRYTLEVVKLLKLGAGAMILAIAALLFVLRRRQRMA
jgi:protein SCO1/2